MHYGPAHSVWEDENFERESVEWCLDHFEEDMREDAIPEEYAAVRQSLVALLFLPDNVLTPCPEDYDNERPEQYPPQVQTVRV